MSIAVNQFLSEFFAQHPQVLEWGVVPLGNKLPHASHLASWVKNGFHAGLKYMEQHLEQRQSPRTLFSWARNAVLFSLRQPKPFGMDTGDFRIASYALGEDYHWKNRKLLHDLETQLRKVFIETQFQFAGFCDTWPVFERDLAAEAGLGWRGKNSCLIHRKHGSGFLLAGFFTDLELKVMTTPQTDFCGGCTACLDECPTNAFVKPGQLDANKCISYWTIEAKGETPVMIAEKSGPWVFGCDICQEVCPWNHKHKQKDSFPPNWPRTQSDWLSLLKEGGGFRKTFKGTPLIRAGRKSMLRNVLISIENVGRPKTTNSPQ